MFKINIKLNKDNYKIKMGVIYLKEYIEFLENGNKILDE